MGVSFAILLFLVLSLGWTLLAFWPALREIRRPTDTEALPVSRDSRVEIRHFARGFRELLEQQYGDLVTHCRDAGEALTGELADGGTFIVVPDSSTDLPLSADEREFCERVIISAADLHLPDEFVHAAEIQAEGDVRGGTGSVYRAVLAGGTLQLAAGSASLRWLHAGGDLTAAQECLLHGRVSADGRLRLHSGCRFERLQAPHVDFGPTVDGPVTADTSIAAGSDREPLAARDVPRLRATDGGRWLVDRGFELAGDALLASDLVVRGKVTLRAGALVQGSIKSRGVMVIEPGVHISGSLICEDNLVLGEDCRVGGPIVCEETLNLQRGCVVGTPDMPTTVSSRRIEVEPGVRCHGTVWAHERGDVLVPVGVAPDAPATEAQTAGGATT